MFIAFLCSAFFFSSIFAQGKSPFVFDPRRDGLFLGMGAMISAAGAFAYLNMKSVDASTLRRENIPCFDRFAVDLSNARIADVSDITSGMAMGLPVVLAVGSRNGRTLCEDALMYAESLMFMGGLTWLSKAVFGRPRPYAYRAAEAGESVLSPNAVRSFFSGHTAVAFNGAVFAGMVFQKRYPDSDWIKPVWAFGLTAATATAVLRVMSGNHFPTDVIAGAVVGSLTGWLIPRLHARSRNENGLSLRMNGGIGLVYQF
jgi:membrane-associated phospholipid phosphatase